MHYDAIIAGAGPGGLSCATKLAESGLKTLVIERKAEIGPKVCAGGITWSGLINTVPGELIERSFPCQHIRSQLQSICLSEPNPIIATVNRRKLGQHMMKVAQNSGATILTSTSLHAIGKNHVDLVNLITQEKASHTYDFLIGADGSSSIVRKHLGLSTTRMGIGINYEIFGQYEKMEWHLNHRFFGNGYGWIFPHKNTISIGAYINKKCLPASDLKKRLVAWAKENRFDLSKQNCTAGYINFDFQGWQFDNTFLVGDAAGFASALTGEGIYPAIISGQSVAEKIIHPSCDLQRMRQLEKKQKRFSTMIDLTSKSSLISALFAEIGILGLRTKVIDFTILEMGQ